MIRFLVRKPVLEIGFYMLVYYLIMELYYYYFVGISYQRFQFYLDIDIAKYIETKILFLLVVLFSVHVSKRSDFIFSIFIFVAILFFIPALVTYSFQNHPAAPLYSIIILLLSIGVISSNKLKIPEIESKSLSRGVILCLVVLFLLPFIYSFGININLKNFLFEGIFETRASYVENSSTLINYLYYWLVKAVIPILIVYFLIRKQNRYAIITLFILLYLYLISGNKIVFITLFIMLFFYYAGKDSISKAKYFLQLLIIGLLLIPLIDAYILESHMLKGTFVMRTLFLPAHLNYFYFDFFHNNPLYYSESNIVKWFLTYPYDRPIGFIISEKYFAASDMNSNNGIISDGYMNLGYWGVAISILVTSITFLFFNSLRIDNRYLGIFFVMIFLFLSAPLLSMFITSGLWIIILFSLTLMKADNEQLITN
jgi:hypothetical protein